MTTESAVHLLDGSPLQLAAGVRTLAYRAGEAQVLVSELAPGAVLPAHTHPEAQCGTCLSGSFTVTVAGEERELRPVERAYAVAPGVPHEARNDSDAVAVGLDIKRLVPGEALGSGFLEVDDERTLKTGMDMISFVGDWFELAISVLPPGGSMPVHQHRHEQIAVGFGGRYEVTVGDDSWTFENGHVYYAPPHVPHGAHNPYNETGYTAVAFVPPRYHRARAIPSAGGA